VSQPPLEDDWEPDTAGDLRSGQFKWGWSEVSGEVVWPVAGPGDGLPSHDAFLSSAWGRAPSSSAGDRLGRARHFASDQVEAAGSALVIVESYYGADVPPSVLEWFQREFPDAAVRASPVRS
jgi:hypothetical protein